ncbi:MAG: hypothetical protein HQL32_06715 [Planctomycetes bacterium]|nr:hypothetical protein [Planctomycetota bacterium]
MRKGIVPSPLEEVMSAKRFGLHEQAHIPKIKIKVWKILCIEMILEQAGQLQDSFLAGMPITRFIFSRQGNRT